jgi:hypothetical protein
MSIGWLGGQGLSGIVTVKEKEAATGSVIASEMAVL